MRLGSARRRLAAIVVALLACLVGYGVASAAFSVGSDHLAAGDRAVAPCDTDGFVIDGFTLDGSSQITHITLSGIDAACIGGQLTVDLTRADAVSVGNGGPVAVTGSPMTVPITGLPDAALVKHEVVIIVGP